MFECNICFKTFETERSYAGHRSSHSRFESYRLNRKKVQLVDLASLQVDPKQCDYCNQQFENGWQLGGHKRHCKLNPKYINPIINNILQSHLFQTNNLQLVNTT